MEHFTESAKVKNRHRNMIWESLVRKNALFVSGLVITPVAAFANTLENSAVLALTFSAITLFTLLFSCFVPKRIVYTIRIIIYTVIASLVYVVTAVMVHNIMPEKIEAMGIYFPLLIINSLIVTRSEVIFSQERRTIMLTDILFCITGYAIAVLFFGLVREILSTGELSGNVLAVPVIYPALQTTFGGFILLGIFAAAYRAVLHFIKRIKS